MRSQSGASNSGDGEQFGDSSKEGRRLGQLGLFDVLIVDGVEIPSGLNLGESKALERLVGLLVSTLLDEPSSGFWTEEDTDGQGNGGNHGATKLKPPVGDDQVGGETQKDTESGPKLPAHDQRSSNGGGRVFGGKDGYCRSLDTHTESENKSGGEEGAPGFGETGRDGRGDETESG